MEAAAVIDRSADPIASRRFDDLIAEGEIAITPVTEAQARIARHADRDFGKGSGHPGKLNFGDCFAYALAKDAREALLFKGNGFSHTDIAPALPDISKPAGDEQRPSTMTRKGLSSDRSRPNARRPTGGVAAHLQQRAHCRGQAPLTAAANTASDQ